MEAWQPERVVRQPTPAAPPRNRPATGLAIIGLVSSLLSLALLVALVVLTYAFPPAIVYYGLALLVSVPLAIAGLVCGLAGRKKASSGEPGRRLAGAALTLGIASLVLHALTILLAVVLVGILVESIDDFDIPEPDNPPGPGDPTPPQEPVDPGASS
ncbi:MAG: hypothetical protein WKF29_05980 [Thermoleophilaceae bacterium]